MNQLEQMAVDVFTEGMYYEWGEYGGTAVFSEDGRRGDYVGTFSDYDMARLSREAGWIIGDAINEQMGDE